MELSLSRKEWGFLGDPGQWLLAYCNWQVPWEVSFPAGDSPISHRPNRSPKSDQSAMASSPVDTYPSVCGVHMHWLMPPLNTMAS